jgi:hypothetical protein
VKCPKVESHKQTPLVVKKKKIETLRLYIYITNIQTTMTNTRAILSNYLLRYILLCIGFITAHYVSAHLYVWWCVPSGVKGYVMSPFLTLSPHCQFLRWVTYNGGVCINACWVLLGSWLISKFQHLLNVLVEPCIKDSDKESDKECVKDSDKECAKDSDLEEDTDESEDNESEQEDEVKEEKEVKVEESTSRTKLRTLRNRLRYKKNT